MTNDKEHIKARFSRNYTEYNLFATVQASICRRLAEKLQRFSLAPERVLEVGAGTGFLTQRLAAMYPTATYVLNDLTEESERFLRPLFDGSELYVAGDAERVDLGSGYDLTATSSTVQWFDDLPAFFEKIAAVTNVGGHFALSTFGNDNFREIRLTTGVGLHYYSLDELRDMLRNSGFEILDYEEYREEMRFDSPLSVLHHIKITGVGGGFRQHWTKGKLKCFQDSYVQLFSGDSGVSLTYNPILLIGCKR